MANYYLNDDGSVTKKKKSTGKTYTLNNEGNAVLQKTNKTQQSNSLKQAVANTNQARQSRLDYFNSFNRVLSSKAAARTTQKPTDLEPTRDIKGNVIDRKITTNNNLQGLQQAVEDRYSLNTQPKKFGSEIKQKVKPQTGQYKQLLQEEREAKNKENLLRYEKNLASVEKDKVGLGDVIANPFLDTINMLDFSRLGEDKYSQVDKKGNVSYLPNKREIKVEKVREKENAVAKAYDNIVSSLGKATLAKTIDLFTGSAAGEVLYYGDIGKSSVDEAKKQGFSDNEALAYGAAATVFAKTIDNVVGSFGGLSGKTVFGKQIPTLEKGLDKLIFKLTNNKLASTVLSSMGSEFTSEFVEEYMDNIAKYAIDMDNKDKESFFTMIANTLPDAAYAGLMGAGAGAVGAGFEKITNSSDLNERIKALEDYKKNLEEQKPNTVEEAQFKEEEMQKIEDSLEAATQRQQEIIKENESEQKYKDKTDDELKDLQLAQSMFDEDTTDVDYELKRREKINEEQENDHKQFLEDSEKMLFEKQDKETLERINQTEEASKLLGLTDEESIKTLNETKKELSVMVKNNYISEKESKTISSDMTKLLKEKEETPSVKYQKGDIGFDKNGKMTTNNKTREIQEQLIKPNKNKETVKEKDITSGETIKAIKPSKELVNQGEEAILKKYQDNVTEREKQKIKKTDEYINATYEKMLAMAIDSGNESLTKQLIASKDKGFFTHVNLSEEISDIMFDMRNDFDGAYDKFMKKYFEFNKSNKDNPKLSLDLQKEAIALYNVFTNIDLNSENAGILAPILIESGNENSLGLNMMKNLYTDNVDGFINFANRDLRRKYFQDVKKHKNDKKWIKNNNPDIKENNSKYRLSKEQRTLLKQEAQKLYDIKDKNSLEYKQQKAKISKYQDKITPTSLGDKIEHYRIGSMLMRTAIYCKNGLENLIILPKHIVSDMVTSGTDVVLSGKTGERTSVYSGKGLIKGFKNYFVETGSIFTEKINKIDSDEYKYSPLKQHETSDINVAKDYFENRTSKYQSKTAVGKLFDGINDIGMELGDRGFRGLAYANSLYDQTLAEAINQVSKNKTGYIYEMNVNKAGVATLNYIDANGEHMTSKVNENKLDEFMSKNNLKEVKITNEMREIARNDAETKTFIDSNETTEHAIAIKNTLNKLSGPLKLGNVLLPMVKVQTNVFRSMYYSSPVALIELKKRVGNLQTEINEGTLTKKSQYEFARYIGDITAGTALQIFLGVLAKNNLVELTGGEEKDKEGKLKKDQGWKPYSIKVGNKYISYDYGGVMGTSMRLAEQYKDEKIPTNLKEIESFFKNNANETLATLIEQATLNNLLEFANTGYGDLVESIENKMASIPATFIPGIVKDIAVTMDNFTQRDTYDGDFFTYTKNQFINKIPKIRENLQPKYDTWGEIKKVGSNAFENYFNTWVASNSVNTEKRSKVYDEILDVYSQNKDGKALPNLNTVKGFKYNGKQYDFSNSEKTNYKKQYGTNLYKNLNKMINSSIYKTSDYNDKQKLLEYTYSHTREQAYSWYLQSKGKTYYNSTKKDGKYTEYKNTMYEEIINNNLSIREAQYKRKQPKSYQLYKAMGGYDKIIDSEKSIKNILQIYKDRGYKTKQLIAITKQMVNNTNLSKIQKVMLAKKLYQSTYENYDNAVFKYLKSQNLTKDEYDYAVKALGLKGYYIPIYKQKRR